jgi:hypothetical protein
VYVCGCVREAEAGEGQDQATVPRTGDRGEVIGERFSSSEMGMGCFISLHAHRIGL